MRETRLLATETSERRADTLVDERDGIYFFHPRRRKPTLDRLIGTSAAMILDFAFGHMETRIAGGTSTLINARH